MPQLVQIIFSWDRPLQLWGLVKSLLDNTDLQPKQIRVLCKISNESYRKSYQTVSKEFGCQIIYQGNRGLWGLILEQIQGNEFVALMVDDLMFFRKGSYHKAIEIMRKESEICIWSWCIGPDLWPFDKRFLRKGYWAAPHATTGIPFNYIFHEDGSIQRRKNFEYWLHLIPKQHQATFNLNRIEAYLIKLPKSVRRNLGSLHAGPLIQTCVTWRINKVSGVYGSPHYGIAQTKPEYLRKVFEKGGRLDYSSLYGRTDWFKKLNMGHSNFAHIKPTKEATNFFMTLIR